MDDCDADFGAAAVFPTEVESADFVVSLAPFAPASAFSALAFLGSVEFFFCALTSLIFLSFRLMECLAVLYHFFSDLHKLFDETMPAEIIQKAVMSRWINQVS